MVAGALHETTGGVVSTTLMVCAQLLKRLQLSSAVHILVIIDAEGQATGATESPNVTVEDVHASVAVANPVADGSVELLHSTVVLAGQAIIGGVVSAAVTEAVSVSDKP